MESSGTWAPKIEAEVRFGVALGDRLWTKTGLERKTLGQGLYCQSSV